MVVWYSHLFKNFPQFVVIHTIKGFSVKFSRQKYWSGVPFPTPGDLDPGIESASLTSPALAGAFITTSATWEALQNV